MANKNIIEVTSSANNATMQTEAAGAVCRECADDHGDANSACKDTFI